MLKPFSIGQAPRVGLVKLHDLNKAASINQASNPGRARRRLLGQLKTDLKKKLKEEFGLVL